MNNNIHLIPSDPLLAGQEQISRRTWLPPGAEISSPGSPLSSPAYTHHQEALAVRLWVVYSVGDFNFNLSSVSYVCVCVCVCELMCTCLSICYLVSIALTQFIQLTAYVSGGLRTEVCEVDPGLSLVFLGVGNA